MNAPTLIEVIGPRLSILKRLGTFRMRLSRSFSDKSHCSLHSTHLQPNVVLERRVYTTLHSDRSLRLGVTVVSLLNNFGRSR